MIGIGAAFRVSVTINAFKSCEIGRGSMAISASIPSPIMLARVDSKILCVVVPVSWSPAVGRVAVLARRGESSCRMVGISRSYVGSLMAAIASCRRSSKSCSMADSAPYRRMPSRKRIAGNAVAI
jgi:hypothetical protein